LTYDDNGRQQLTQSTHPSALLTLDHNGAKIECSCLPCAV